MTGMEDHLAAILAVFWCQREVETQGPFVTEDLEILKLKDEAQTQVLWPDPFVTEVSQQWHIPFVTDLRASAPGK